MTMTPSNPTSPSPIDQVLSIGQDELVAQIADRTRQIGELEARIADARADLQRLTRHGMDMGARAHAVVESELQQNATALAATWRERNAAEAVSWEDDAAWDGWQPEVTTNWSRLRVGQMLDARDQTPLGPHFVPFIGSGRTIVITTQGGDDAAARGHQLLLSVLVRSAALLPHQVKYTLLDPAGSGRAFPMARMLPNVEPSSADVRRDLDAVTEDIRRIISSYLDPTVTSFEHLPPEMRLNERFHLVVAADFPRRYDLRALEALQAIDETGHPAGAYLLVHHHLDHEMTGDVDHYRFRNALVVPVGDGSAGELAGLQTSIVFDQSPSPQRQEALFRTLKALAPVERSIAWDDIVNVDRDDWWQETSAQRVRTPIGRSGGIGTVEALFGEDTDGRPCVHGIIGAMPGAGKSTLFHTLITGLAVRYAPDQLRLYLIDGKFGVEFAPYRHLPHAEVVSLKTSPHMSRSVLADLAEEMERRNVVFTRHGVQDLPGYVEAGEPEGRMPRTLLVIDEYQQLFDEDREGEASDLLLRLSQLGRSAGIHMLLASQRYDVPGMLHKVAIFGNIHLRMAMQMTDSDVRALTEFGPRGRNLILATCNLPGKLVVNASGGDDDSNTAGKAAIISDDRRTEILVGLREEADRTDHRDRIPIVINGENQPTLRENPLLRRLVDRPGWAAPEELEAFARSPVVDGGLGIDDWLAGEHPLLGLLGQEFNVRGFAKVVLRRRATENVAVVGSHDATKVGVLAAMVASIAATCGPDRVGFRIIDRCVEGSPCSATLTGDVGSLLEETGHDVRRVRSEGDADALIAEVADEVDRRRALPESDRSEQPSLVVILNDPDRLESICRVLDDFGATDSELGARLTGVVAQGPGVGVHVVIGAASVPMLTTVLSEQLVNRQIRHKIAFQMSEDDAFSFVRTAGPSKLQQGGPRPISAIYLDVQRQASATFKPYSVEGPLDAPDADLRREIEALARDLASSVPAASGPKRARKGS